jgi:hypothetical protein
MTYSDTEVGFRDRYLLAGIATSQVDPEEIDDLAESFGVRFPAAYRAYLRVCGTAPPKELIGSDCTIRHLTSINEFAPELISENNAAEQFPEPIFVFLMHQGYTFLYFLVDDSDDPAVFCYLEGDPEPKRVSDRFSDWATGLGTLGG